MNIAENEESKNGSGNQIGESEEYFSKQELTKRRSDLSSTRPGSNNDLLNVNLKRTEMHLNNNCINVAGDNNNVTIVIPKRKSEKNYFNSGDKNVFLPHSKKIPLSDKELMSKIKPCLDYKNKLGEIKKYLENNLEVADLKINLYISACDNACLSPYPNYIIEDSFIGLESLSLINEFIPPLGILKHYLQETNTFIPNEHVVNVLHWLLLTFPEPNIVKLKKEDFDRIVRRVENRINLKIPSHSFVLKYKRASENHWISSKGDLDTKFAFLSVKMEHVHSVVHLGIHPQMFVDGKYGFGLYLTTDLGCCLESTPSQWVWGKSSLGIETQIILIVEFAMHPDVITYNEKNALCKKENDFQMNGSAAKLYFLSSYKLIRVRYIMLFVKTPSPLKSRKLAKRQTPIFCLKYSLLFLTLTISAILAKRTRLSTLVYSIYANIVELPIFKRCLSIVR